MLINLIKDTSSKEFANVIQLGDLNSRTLGFLPHEAFKKYAKEGKLIGASDEETNELIGYLLYRVSYNKVTIVHCCVDANRRGESIAYRLISYLKKNTKNYDGIRLSCRNDYGLNEFWEKCNFVPIKEKVGRSKKGLPLTIWWFPHNQNNLLSLISDYELNNKIVAVIDMNIFLDIKNKREQESLALESDWLLSETTLYYTREIFVEINRGKSNEIKNSSRRAIQKFELLPFRDEDLFKKVLKELSEEFAQRKENDKSDLNHLAYSITGGAHYFITRDSELLNNKSFFKQYDLMLFRPSEFITHLDEILQRSKYQPQRLIGTNINSKSVTSSNVDSYIEKFLKPGERKTHLQKLVRYALSHPKQHELITVSKSKELLAFFIYDRTSPNILNIPVFRLMESKFNTTLSKHLIYGIISTALNDNRIKVEINEKYIDHDILPSLKKARFTRVNTSWKKINLKGISSFDNVNCKYENDKDFNTIKENVIRLNRENETTDHSIQYSLERFLFPVKLIDVDILTYIVPIKPFWAEQLIQDKSGEKLPFFEPEYELLLNRENVYYRSAKPKILDSPARILWYQSENKQTSVKGHICACSYIDQIFIDKPKKLFKQFEHLGIYKWKDIAKTSKSRDSIMAFIFSDTEVFDTRVSVNQIEKLFDKFENKKFMILSPIKIKSQTFIELYKRGFRL